MIRFWATPTQVKDYWVVNVSTRHKCIKSRSRLIICGKVMGLRETRFLKVKHGPNQKGVASQDESFYDASLGTVIFIDAEPATVARCVRYKLILWLWSIMGCGGFLLDNYQTPVRPGCGGMTTMPLLSHCQRYVLSHVLYQFWLAKQSSVICSSGFSVQQTTVSKYKQRRLLQTPNPGD